MNTKNEYLQQKDSMYILGLFSESICKMEERIFNKIDNSEDVDVQNDLLTYCDDLIISYKQYFMFKDKNADRIFVSLCKFYKTTQVNLLTLLMDNRNQYEKELYKIFDAKVKDILGNCAEIIKVKNNKENIPDRWVKYKNYLIPVEFKRYEFTEKHKEQLERYMKFYNSSFGIAIGKELATSLNDNMLFISIEDMKNGKSVAQQLQKNLKDMYIETTNRSTGQMISNRDRKIEELEGNV